MYFNISNNSLHSFCPTKLIRMNYNLQTADIDICFSLIGQYYVINLSRATNYIIILHKYAILVVCCRIINQNPSKYKGFQTYKINA